MEINDTTTIVAVRDEVFTTQEQIALGGFLAGYSGLTRDAYALDLRQYVAWCTEHAVEPDRLVRSSATRHVCEALTQAGHFNYASGNSDATTDRSAATNSGSRSVAVVYRISRSIDQ